MNTYLKDWLDFGIKALGLIAVVIAALGYYKQVKIKKGEWLQLLFEKFYENDSYKIVRKWIDNHEIEKRITSDDTSISEDEEKFTDFLNFFEFIANLEAEKQISTKDVTNLFDYYLRKIKSSSICIAWIKKYGFEKLDYLLNKIINE